MERQTRQLLGILADDLTDRLVEALAPGEMLETDLQHQLPSSRQTISRRLEELELWGVVSGEDRPTPGRGRPTRAWRLTGTAVLAFRRDAEELLLRLLEERAARHREAIHQPPRGGEVRRLRP
jgi:predicted ArsR family transcriptional regulator